MKHKLFKKYLSFLFIGVVQVCVEQNIGHTAAMTTAEHPHSMAQAVYDAEA